MAYINQDKASWYFVVSNGRDPVTNKPRQIKKRGFPTKEEASLAALEIELQIKKGQYFEGANMKFHTLYDEWIRAYSISRKKSSVRNRECAAKHLLRVWSNTSINQITKPVYRRYMDSLVDTYMYNTRDGIHTVARMIFDFAVDMEYLEKNPCEKYSVPKRQEYKEDQKKLVFLEKEELKEFLQLAKDEGLEQDYLMFNLLAFSGIRIGEALTLKWKDIDFKSNVLSIERTLFNPTNNKLKFELQSTKYSSSERKILIDPFVVDLLENHKIGQEQFIRKNKRLYKNQGFVFTCSEGYPRTIKLISNRLQRLLTKMDIDKHITPHSFRHTHASLLIEANVNMKVISHRLGHSTTEEVEKTYGHMTKGLEKKASHQFNELMKDLLDLE